MCIWLFLLPIIQCIIYFYAYTYYVLCSFYKNVWWSNDSILPLHWLAHIKSPDLYLCIWIGNWRAQLWDIRELRFALILCADIQMIEEKIILRLHRVYTIQFYARIHNLRDLRLNHDCLFLYIEAKCICIRAEQSWDFFLN